MRAAVVRRLGPPEVLKLEPDFPAPTRKPGEVLVRVAAAGINPIDAKTRGASGGVPARAVTLPKILGGDVAGVVEAADDGSAFKPGQRVFGCTGQQMFTSTYGTYAELCSVAESSLLPIPDGVSFEEAAAVPLAAQTAWQAMQPAMPLAGKRLLIHAGAGGVGHFAIQIAKAQGAFVATTCSGRNAEFVTALGADRAIDYTKERFEDAFPGTPYDLVVDLIGGDYELRSLPLLKPKSAGGRFAHVLNSGFVHQRGLLWGLPALMFYTAKHALAGALGFGPAYSVTVMRHQASNGLKQVAELMQEGKLKPTVAKVFPLEQAAAAHELLETAHVRGKVVLRVAEL